MTKCNVHETALTWLVYELLSCRFGRFRLHTSLRLRALIRSWQGVYVCKFRSTRTRFQFKKTLPVEHSPEHFCCIGTHFQAFMNLSDVFFLRCFSEARKKPFRRNFRKCSRMRPIDVWNGVLFMSSFVVQKQMATAAFCCFILRDEGQKKKGQRTSQRIASTWPFYFQYHNKFYQFRKGSVDTLVTEHTACRNVLLKEMTPGLIFTLNSHTDTVYDFMW